VALVTEAVWTSVLGLELACGDAALARRTTLTHAAIVQITGAFRGAVCVRCTPAVSSRLASILLGTDEPSPEDCCEALAEVANLVTGNLKTLLPGPSTRSMPAVVDGDECHVRFPGARVIADATFESEGEPLRVTIHQRGD
jgi:chemotaxis protein CheX